MIVGGKTITELVLNGPDSAGRAVVIRPFDVRNVNPNSYDLRLHNELLTYPELELDMQRAPRTEKITIPENGLLMMPGKLYLGRTVEYTETKNLVPVLEGRSSVGRLGIQVHITAGFGDAGFRGYWTLELTCIQPVRIYAGVRICQIAYSLMHGEHTPYISSKYQDSQDILPSRIWKDFAHGH